MKQKVYLPTVYLDTSIFSALHYKGGSFLGVYRARATREWWENERHYFRLYTSAVAQRELTQGVYGGQEAAVAEAHRIAFLQATKEAAEQTALFLEAGLVPKNKPADAAQLALANVHQVDYLMSWNYAHLANPEVQARLEVINVRFGWRTPLLVSPDSIPKAAMGQAVRRRG